MPDDRVPTLTQGLRDEIITDLRNLNIPGVQSDYVKKMGALPQTRAAILVNVDDQLEIQDIASSIRLMQVTIMVCTYIPQDRDGDFMDLVTSYVEQYVRTPMSFGDHAGYVQTRAQQMLGASRRMDIYGEQAWYVSSLEMVVPYVNQSLCPAASASASVSPS